jgi:hypothetical protein
MNVAHRHATTSARRAMHARRMRSIRLLATAALALSLASSGARAGDATGAWAPYEDLTEVVATLAWHLPDDLYRFPPPKDPTGHDVYRLSLERLESWETRFPGRLRDVTTFARAEALERLGEWRRATDAYAQVAAMPDSSLATRAREHADRARGFADAAALPEDGADLHAQLANLQKKLDAWSALVERHKGTPYEALALVEEERVERRAADLIVARRHDVEHGDETAEKALGFLIAKHADSKELASHVLALGDLEADLAREWLAAHDRPLAFDEDQFVVRADRALDAYRKISTWDGAPEKPQGQGRFAALEAWKADVLARYR